MIKIISTTLILILSSTSYAFSEEATAKEAIKKEIAQDLLEAKMTRNVYRKIETKGQRQEDGRVTIPVKRPR